MHVIKNKTQKVVIISIFLVFASLLTLVRYNENSYYGKYPSFTTDENIKQSDIITYFTLTGGAGIYIDDSDPSNNWITNKASFDWIDGDGTLGSPYEIVNVLFDGEAINMNLITIKNSVAYFRIEECILYNTAKSYWDEESSNAIYLENVENGIISNVDTSDCNNGIRLVNSGFNRIQGVFASNNYHSAIAVSGGSKNRIKNTTVTGSGIWLVDGTFNNDVLENIITTGSYEDDGIFLSNSDYNNVTFNMISDRYESSGISLSASDYNNISGNTISNSGIGLEIHNSGYNFVSANLIVNSTDPWVNPENFDPDYDNGVGLQITSSTLNIISKNDISDCEFLGIYISDSNNHSIWENTVMNSGIDDIHLIDTPFIDMALNEMYGSGLYFEISTNDLNDTNIETSNLVNGKSIYFYVNRSGLGQADFINAGQIFLFGCHDIVISGLEFDLVTTGITMVYSFNNTISLNEASNNSRWAFSLTSCDYNSILNNDVTRSSIILKVCNYTKFIGNNAFYSKTDGVSFENCHNNHISGNTASYNNEIGFKLHTTNNVLIHNNIANNNNKTGISFSGTPPEWIWNGTDYVFRTFYGFNNTVTSNKANDNGIYGIVMTDVSNIIITGNTAKNNIEGITLDSFESGIISENEVTGNEIGLSVIHGSDAIVNNNTAISNIEYWGSSGLIRGGNGILIEDCHDVEVSDNVANRNSQGITLSGCSACDVNYNHLSDNGKEDPFFLFPTTPSGDTGILISGHNINVTGNILNNNGIGVTGSDNNFFLNQITGFGFVIRGSGGNIISGNLITNALIAIDLVASSYNNITFNIIVAQQCFRERGNCTSNVFEDNDCTEVLPEFYLPEIVSILGLSSVLGINIPLFIKKRKNRK